MRRASVFTVVSLCAAVASICSAACARQDRTVRVPPQPAASLRHASDEELSRRLHDALIVFSGRVPTDSELKSQITRVTRSDGSVDVGELVRTIVDAPELGQAMARVIPATTGTLEYYSE